MAATYHPALGWSDCRCGPARNRDGSENGMCEACERRADQEANGLTDDDLEAMLNASSPGFPKP